TANAPVEPQKDLEDTAGFTVGGAAPSSTLSSTAGFTFGGISSTQGPKIEFGSALQPSNAGPSQEKAKDAEGSKSVGFGFAFGTSK
ncbi:hypothetical protein HDU76_011877, partial [Blyttiomyces sp. JEL0837]